MWSSTVATLQLMVTHNYTYFLFSLSLFFTCILVIFIMIWHFVWASLGLVANDADVPCPGDEKGASRKERHRWHVFTGTTISKSCVVLSLINLLFTNRTNRKKVNIGIQHLGPFALYLQYSSINTLTTLPTHLCS